MTRWLILLVGVAVANGCDAGRSPSHPPSPSRSSSPRPRRAGPTASLPRSAATTRFAPPSSATRVVVLEDEDVQNIDKPELNVYETYAKHGRCGSDCPVLDYEFYGDDAEFAQSDVAASIDALVEPYRYHFE